MRLSASSTFIDNGHILGHHIRWCVSSGNFVDLACQWDRHERQHKWMGLHNREVCASPGYITEFSGILCSSWHLCMAPHTFHQPCSWRMKNLRLDRSLPWPPTEEARS
mmetsp:Transcript_13618/g.42091  ORF Transcript_13618/g.42091 Transcript_13618/m.42091 type:complete len:108 (-) Transcript_13618:495-818(-)